jgi:hypothetical protein
MEVPGDHTSGRSLQDQCRAPGRGIAGFDRGRQTFDVRVPSKSNGCERLDRACHCIFGEHRPADEDSEDYGQFPIRLLCHIGTLRLYAMARVKKVHHTSA